LPAFLDADSKATPEMRLKTFTLRERAVLIPIELVASLKPAAMILLAVFLIGGFAGSGDFWTNAMNHGLLAAVAVAAAILAGTLLTPILLPWLPGRAFAMKGAVLGVIVSITLAAVCGSARFNGFGAFEMLAWFLIITALTAYLAMNFTGASTYTSLSGVRREMRFAVPLEIAAGAIGLVLWLGSLFLA
jgi:hypothetical protein